MLWNLISLQKLLDALFDEGWNSLGLPEKPDAGDAQCAEA